MKALMAGLRAWWLRRFRGYVAPPRQHGGRGTTWQEHRRSDVAFECRCGLSLAFSSSDYVIRSQDHREDCIHLMLGAEVSAHALQQSEAVGCDCPVTDARFVKICPNCHLGHWKDASPK